MKNFIEKLRNNKFFIPLVLMGFVSLLFVAEFVSAISEVLLILIFLCFAFICVMFDFENSLLIIVCLLPFGKFKTELMGVWWLNWLYVIFVVIFGVTYIKDIVLRKRKVYWLIVALNCVLIIISFVNFQIQNISNLFSIALILMFLYLCFVNKEKIDVNKIANRFVFSVIVSIVVGVIFLNCPNLKNSVLVGPEQRFAGFSGHPNMLQMFCVMSIAILVILIAKRKISKPKFLVELIVLLFAGMNTGSKTFFLCLAVLIGISLILIIKNFKQKALFLVIGVFVFIGIMSLLFSEQIEKIIDRFFAYDFYENKLDQILTGRWSIWGAYIDQWQSSIFTILFGCGITTAEVVAIGTHSSYIWLLCKYGIIGCIVVVGLIVTYLFNVSNIRTKFSFLNCIPLIIFLFLSIVESLLIPLCFWTLWLSILLVFDNNKSSKKRVLFYNGTLLKGGTETYMLNVIKNLNRDNFDVDVIIKNGKNYDAKILKELEELGCQVTICNKESNFSQLKYMLNILYMNQNKYDIMHINATSRATGIVLFLAKEFGGINKTIFHSHMGGNDHPSRFWDVLGFAFIMLYADKRVSCSKIASEYMFGKRFSKLGKVQILNNFIDIDHFDYNEKTRKKMRKQLNISQDTFVLIHVGRFVEQKNHRFLINLFSEYLKTNPNTLLLLLGEGDLMPDVQQQVEELNLLDNVNFVGSCSNVNEYLQAADCFIMTSLHEGLPFVAVEAQACGLPCVLSNRISSETNITNNCYFLDIYDDTLQEWVKVLDNIKSFNRVSVKKLIIEKNFAIESAIKVVEEIYNS